MDKQYQHHHHEEQIYQLWQKADNFNPDANSTTTNQSFSIIMPPPNANDPLHVGHAMFLTIEDILIRYHRMLGDDTLWLPGTDHAGIETQFVFEKKLKKQGQSRFNFDRQTLYQMIWDYVQENSDVAVNQMKKIGASADWSRFSFMLDPILVGETLATFQRLHHDNLVYRDLRLVNYCTKCGTSFSELEIDHIEQKTPLFYIKYGPLELATTRPETKFGDTAVAVNPNDDRYQKYIGQEIEVDGLNGPFTVKVIADDYVDPEFGTGVVKITPAHDHNDFEVWQRHQAEIPGPKQVIDFDGKLNQHAGKYAGMKIAAAREKIRQNLAEKGLLVKVDDNYTNSVAVCYRCGTIIEPLPLAQFFIKVKPLADRALQALDNQEVRVHGAGHDKILHHWLENLRDWNISRQIVWGIRMPVWYSLTAPENMSLQLTYLDASGQRVIRSAEGVIQEQEIKLAQANLQQLRAPIQAKYVLSQTSPGDDYIQETDTFDTWFSSGQWPVNTLKHSGPDDFNRFYPTSVMETGYDILPFWVMRMLMLGLYLTDKVPFADIYLHGLVRDQHGKKMSKSKGNVINPLEVIEKYGADALRMALVIRTTPGLDKSVGEPDFKAMRNFTNKIWNAARFITLMAENDQLQVVAENAPGDQVFTQKLTQTVQLVTTQLNDLRIGLAAETVYNQFWHWFCDECIENAKTGQISQKTLFEGLTTFLKLLHPFVPFVTEAIWQTLAEDMNLENDLLITAKWPH